MQRDCEVRGRTMFGTLYDFYVWVRDWDETCKKLKKLSNNLDRILLIKEEVEVKRA